jgi:hypothetical protein
MSSLEQKLASVNNHYGEINNLSKNNTYKYIQVSDTENSPIDIGSMCNDENYINTGYLDTSKYWEVEDNIEMCFTNAKTIWSNMKFEEEKFINSNSVVKQSGLSIIEKSSNGHFEDDVQFFKDTAPSTTYISELNTGIKANSSVDLFGYFVPNITGTWTFSTLNTEIALFWIKDDHALYDYTINNADISSRTVSNDGSRKFSISLKKDEYYPIRIQLANLTSFPNTRALFSVLSPKQELIVSNTPNHNYFVSLLYANKLYMKKQLYFGLVRSRRSIQGKPLFHCFFVDSSSRNYDTIKKLKVNEPRLFKTSEIPTTITYESAKYNVSSSADDMTPINILSPQGSNLQILNSKYGLLKDRLENQPIPLIVPETDPEKTIKKDNIPYLYRELYDRNQYRDANGQRLLSSFVQPKPTKTIYNDNWVSVPSSSDTTKINQSLVNANKLYIDGAYNNTYGDPAPGYRGKIASIEYRYSQKFDTNDPRNNITNKTIYLDSTGQLVIGYFYNGTTNSSVISYLNNSDKCTDPNLCNYVLKLKDNGNLAIYNNLKTEIWNMKLANLRRPNKIMPINSWLKNPRRRSILNRGEKLSPNDVPELISDNGKFKLKFENGKLIVRYAYIPYNTIDYNKFTIKYTTNSISDNGRQLYYLYRVNASGLNGKKFLSRTSKSGNNSDNTLWYLQNNTDKVLKFSTYNYNMDKFPLLLARDYDNIISTTTQSNIDNKYNITNITEENCKTSCQNNLNCEHFFYMNTSTGGKCIQDTLSNSTPMFTYNNPRKDFKSSYLGNKQYNIYTTCGYNAQSQPLNSVKGDAYAEYNIMYNNVSRNDSQTTYYCADDKYIANNEKILDIYNSKSGFTTMEGMTIIEGAGNMFDNTINKLQTNASTLQQKQVDVSNNYLTTINRLNRHKDLSSELDRLLGSDLYKNNNSDKIALNTYHPRIDSSKPETSIQDALKKDTNIMILQQNSLYTIGTITAATLLIFSIILARE